jgi:adenosylcobinamide kinase / adenosylcobinamide-phosphate guanylyltransferase
VILIGGGSRSGKSDAGLRMLRSAGLRMGFIATAQASDDEMRHRIARHRAERGPEIETWEEPFAVAERIATEDGKLDGVVVDCLTLWLSNMLLAGNLDPGVECRKLLDVCARARAEVILITNEVGCGIVPDNSLARRFRDEAGRLNQEAAKHASEVHWMIFGVALRIK